MAPVVRSKFGAPMFVPEVFRKQMHCVEESACNIVRTFRRPPQSFVSPIMIWLLGNFASLVTLLDITKLFL